MQKAVETVVSFMFCGISWGVGGGEEEVYFLNDIFKQLLWIINYSFSFFLTI